MKRFSASMFLFVLLMCAGCMPKKHAVTPKTNPGDWYNSGFPAGNVSADLEKITRSVKKVYSISSYTTYQFRRESRITGYHLKHGGYRSAAWGIISTNETVFGTATLVGRTGSRIALLTCAHLVGSPDTVITWFEPEGDDPIAYIRSLSVKEKQENWVKDLSSCGSFSVLATDKTNDIAILGRNCENLTDSVALFSYPAGQSKNLGWGSFVYIFGYPMGNQVITSGIVSPALKRPMGEYSVDALLNKGCSGGIIVATRGSLPNFELVGIVKTVVSTREEFLKPSTDNQRMADWIPYKGNAYVGTEENIQYGLNAVVPMEMIREFYKVNREELVAEGYNLDGFFQPPLEGTKK